MFDIYSVASLNRILERLRNPGSHIADQYFPMVQSTDPATSNGSSEIFFETVNEQPRITPLVSPLIEGKVVDDYGSRVQSFTPAYAKDKRRFLPHRALKRHIGERIGGSMSPMQRLLALIQWNMRDQQRMLQRRWEVMCSELIRTGSVTVTGDEYPTQVVDFGRDPALTIALAGATRWGEVGVNPLQDLEDWVQLIQDTSGFLSLTVTMDSLAWGYLRESADLEKKLDQRRNTNITVSNDPDFGSEQQQALFKGSWGPIDLYVYNDSYIDEAENAQRIIPDNTVIIGGPAAEGTRAYGVIHDEEAGFSAPESFTKSWLQKDPSVRWMLMQAAPLPVLYRPNTTLCATVR